MTMPRVRDVPCLDTLATEIVLAGHSVLFGLWLLLPFDSFNERHARLASVMSESDYGLLAVVIGVARLAAICYGRYSRHLSLASAAYWAAIAVGLGMQGWRGTGIPTYGWFALANFLIFPLSSGSGPARRVRMH